jgi:hypothetical protein
MKSLQLIAIRPLSRCDKKFLKVLKVNRPYVFYHEYDFSGFSDKQRKVLTVPKMYPDLYSFTNSNKEKITINISAVVGENGSGKSSIVELFYVACYNLAVIKEVLFDEEEERLLGVKDLVKNINVEIFYKVNDQLLSLKLRGRDIEVSKCVNNIFVVDAQYQFDFHQFFYTISINYSLHALNSRVLGIWVKKVFHKNDGYRTPIVLNPFRKEGNIEINNEEYLIKYRLIANILGKISKSQKTINSLRNVIDRKVAYRLHANLNRGKFKYDSTGRPVFELTQKYGKTILPRVYHHFLNDAGFIPKDTLLNRYAQEYIIYKLINIASKYDPYKRLFQFFYEEKGELEAYLTILKTENSHITAKLVQAINSLSNKLYFDRKESFDLTISYLSGQLNKQVEFQGKELIDILPPPFFNLDIEFLNQGFFSELSSGEKQRVFSVATLLYHLNNLNSTNEKTISYKYHRVNIIFDELELYFHPELQRTLVNDILINVKKLDLKKINAMNILFITHSPFILSDIPSQNILVLEKDGSPKKDGLNLQTFGANIFDLLKHNFFLENGPMGELAKTTICNTIDWLNKEKRNLAEKTHHKQIIGIIGEPVLQIKLAEMYDEITKEHTEEQLLLKKIAALQNDLKKVQRNK